MNVYISDLKDHAGQTVTVRGWLYNKRSSGKIKFAILRDGTGYLQGVLVKGECNEEAFDLFERLTQESSFAMAGIVREDKRAPGGYEMTVKDLTVFQIAEEYPISLKDHKPGFLMDNRHLWLRSSRQHAIMRVRNEIIMSIRQFFYERGFVLIDSGDG